MARKKLIIENRTRALFRQHGYWCATGLIEAIDAEVEEMLKNAMMRADANRRKTVKVVDL